MQIEAHNRLQPLPRTQVSRLVVYDDYGNPLAVFLQVGPNQIHFRHKGQPGFDEALNLLGIRDTSVVEVMSSVPRIQV